MYRSSELQHTDKGEPSACVQYQDCGNTTCQIMSAGHVAMSTGYCTSTGGDRPGGAVTGNPGAGSEERV